MKKILLPAILLIFIGCEREFEPELKGWQAYSVPGRPLVHLNIDGREKTISLPGDENVRYWFAQWTKSRDRILFTQVVKTELCYDYQLIAADTMGNIADTIYTAPPNIALNFKLAPNDSLLLLKTYHDNCEESDEFKYTFYDRYSKTPLPDTITVENSRGILLGETIWSPDSKKVIISKWSGYVISAFVYDLVTKDTTYIDKGSNFLWSPIDTNMVAYIKDYSIYSLDIATGDKEVIYSGKKKKSATYFRWNPNGEFLMIHIKSYLLNVVAEPLQANRTIYLSMPDKRESDVFYESQRIDTWRGPAAIDKK